MSGEAEDTSGEELDGAASEPEAEEPTEDREAVEPEEATEAQGGVDTPEPAEGSSTAETDDGPGVEKAEPLEPLDEEEACRALEALLFVAEKPVPLRRLARALRRRSAEVRPVLSKLVEAYEDRGLYIVEVGGGFQFRTHPATADVVQKFLAQRPVRMSRAQMETLSIIAYRQPVTRPEVDEIRGVDTASSIKTLAERGFIKIIGRKDEPGRPLLYGTTDFFLEFFGLKALKDLPTLTEFSELTEESKDIFQRRTGEGIDLQAVAAAARQEEMDRAEEPDELDDDDLDDLDDEPESEVSESEAPDVSVESGGDEEPEGSETSEERESEAGPDEELAD